MEKNLLVIVVLLLVLILVAATISIGLSIFFKAHAPKEESRDKALPVPRDNEDEYKKIIEKSKIEYKAFMDKESPH